MIPLLLERLTSVEYLSLGIPGSESHEKTVEAICDVVRRPCLTNLVLKNMEIACLQILGSVHSDLVVFCCDVNLKNAQYVVAFLSRVLKSLRSLDLCMSNNLHESPTSSGYHFVCRFIEKISESEARFPNLERLQLQRFFIANGFVKKIDWLFPNLKWLFVDQPAFDDYENIWSLFKEVHEQRDVLRNIEVLG